MDGDQPFVIGRSAGHEGVTAGSRKYLQDVVEQALTAQGGEELLADAHDRAAEFVDQAVRVTESSQRGSHPQPSRYGFGWSSSLSTQIVHR